MYTGGWRRGGKKEALFRAKEEEEVGGLFKARSM